MTARRIMITLLAIGLATMLTGCIDTFNEAIETAKVRVALDSFIDKIENFDVPGIMAAITMDFVLSIDESGFSYSKTRSKLLDELLSDELYQLDARARGYEMRVDLDGISDPKATRDSVNTVVITEVKNRSAMAYSFFEVFESFEDIEDWLSDSGKMSFELVRYSSGWRLSAMKIQFGPFYDTRSANIDGRGGFGLGGLMPRF